MSDPDFTIKRGDTSPSITVRLMDSDDPIALENGNVGFRMKHTREEIMVKGTCEIDADNPNEVSYIWEDGDTDTIGHYDAEFIVDYSDPGDIDDFDVDETFPSDGYIEIEITEPLE